MYVNLNPFLILYTTLYISYPSAVKEVCELNADSGAKGEAKIALKSSSSLHADLSQKSRVTNQTGEIVEPEKKRRRNSEEDGGLLNRAGPDYYQATLILTKVSV